MIESSLVGWHDNPVGHTNYGGAIGIGNGLAVLPIFLGDRLEEVASGAARWNLFSKLACITHRPRRMKSVRLGLLETKMITMMRIVTMKTTHAQRVPFALFVSKKAQKLENYSADTCFTVNASKGKLMRRRSAAAPPFLGKYLTFSVVTAGFNGEMPVRYAWMKTLPSRGMTPRQTCCESKQHHQHGRKRLLPEKWVCNMPRLVHSFFSA